MKASALRFLKALPLLVVLPFAIVICALALALTDAFWAVFGRRRIRRDTKPETHAASLVIPNWNGIDLLEKFLPSWVAAIADHPGSEIIVVDNGSTDGSAERVLTLADDRVEVVLSKVNIGYTGGSNIAMRHALEMGAEYLWLFNNDAVTEPETLGSLVKLAESDERIGLLTPQIAALDEDRLTFAGGVIDVKRGVYNETHDPQVAAAWMRDHLDAGLVIGTAMLIRVAMIREIGMPEAGLDRAADLAVADPYWNPRPFDRAAIRALLDDAWHGRRPAVRPSP